MQIRVDAIWIFLFKKNLKIQLKLRFNYLNIKKILIELKI